MATNLQIPLSIARDIEPERSWENVTTPFDMVMLCAKLLSVDISRFQANDGFAFSSIEPTGADRGKIWIKTEGMPAIGIPIGGRYEIIYKYPPSSFFIWKNGLPLPSYLRSLTEGELTGASLTKPTDSRFIWVTNDEV